MKENIDKELFFHLGLPKAASTYLQVAVFPKLEDIEYYRKRKFKHFVKLTNSSVGKKLLFTTESDRGFDEKLDNIISNFPESKIILVFRRHDKWIASKYKYSIRKHGNLLFKDFFDLENDNGFWKREELYFNKFIEETKRATKHDPLVLTMDELKKDHHLFIKKITDYLKISPTQKRVLNKVVNKSFSEKQLILLRRFNSFYPYQELRSKNRTINKIHYKYREFLLHALVFLFKFIPRSFTKNEELIPKKELEKIKLFYKEDWIKIENFAKGQI